MPAVSASAGTAASARHDANVSAGGPPERRQYRRGIVINVSSGGIGVRAGGGHRTSASSSPAGGIGTPYRRGIISAGGIHVSGGGISEDCAHPGRRYRCPLPPEHRQRRRRPTERRQLRPGRRHRSRPYRRTLLPECHEPRRYGARPGRRYVIPRPRMVAPWECGSRNSRQYPRRAVWRWARSQSVPAASAAAPGPVHPPPSRPVNTTHSFSRSCSHQ